VSAAHCLVDEFGRTSAQSVTAIIGEKDIRRVPNRAMYNVKTFIVPTTFAPARNGNLQGDIAVLKLDRAVPSEFKPIQLASKDTSIPPWLVVAGWGVTETNRSPSSKLKYVAVPSLTVSQVKKFGQMTGTYFQMEDDKMAAGLGEGDSCSGDSGGPLIIPSKDEFTNSDADKSVLVGVVSYGLSARCQSGKNTVGFYTAIEPYANWIKSEIGGRRLTKKKKRSRKEA
jgi:secreted trypsin-like serine protease